MMDDQSNLITSRIMWYVNNDVNGDDDGSRLMHFLLNVARTAIVHTSDNISDNYQEYRCFTLFNFEQPFSGYELDRWVRSYLDLTETYPFVRMSCCLKESISHDVCHVIKQRILPDRLNITF